MKSPITGKEMVRMQRKDEIVFRKESFPIVFNYYYCKDSKEVFTDEALDTLNVNQAYNQYREKYHLPFPDEIKSIREQYGVSAAKMAEIMGFGINHYRHYENGEVPSISNARLIQLAKDPAEFKKLVDISKALEGKSLTSVMEKIDALINEQNDFMRMFLPGYLMTGNPSGSPNIYTGYRSPSLQKLVEMIVYFTEKLQPYKTKLNKLLFYADFLHFKKQGFSISGAEYYAINMGPVPNNFSSIFEYADNNKFIEICFQEFAEGKIGEQFKPNNHYSFQSALFDDDELSTLETITSKFKNATAKTMIDISHKERAWIDNCTNKERIKYDYAFELLHA